MNRDKLKIIIKNMELLTQSLKEEVYADTSAYEYGELSSQIKELTDYDEVYDDD